MVFFAPERKLQESPVLREGGVMEACILQIYRNKPVFGSGLSHDMFECQQHGLRRFRK